MKSIGWVWGLAISLSGLAIPGYAATVSLQWNGTGCPKGDENGDSSDGKLVAKRDVSSTFEVKSGPGVRLMESRKNCALILSSKGAKERFALEKVELSGTRVLGGIGKQDLMVDVSTQGQGRGKTITFESGTDSKYTLEKTLAEEALLWSSCERGLMLNARQRVDGKEGASAGIDTISYTFKSKACSK